MLSCRGDTRVRQERSGRPSSRGELSSAVWSRAFVALHAYEELPVEVKNSLIRYEANLCK